jgi:hypothetical protein
MLSYNIAVWLLYVILYGDLVMYFANNILYCVIRNRML